MCAQGGICSLKLLGNVWTHAPLQSGDVSSQASADSKVAETFFYLDSSVLLDYLLLPFQITVISNQKPTG